MVLVPPYARPGVPVSLGNHEARIRALERQRAAGRLGRVVYGAVLDDGGTVDAGSGDWSVVWDGMNTYTFTVTPGFSAAILNVVATPAFEGDGNDPYLAIVDTSSSDPSTFVVLTFNFIGDVGSSSFAFAAIEDPA